MAGAGRSERLPAAGRSAGAERKEVPKWQNEERNAEASVRFTRKSQLLKAPAAKVKALTRSRAAGA